MKKHIFSLLAFMILSVSFAFSQNDKIYFHNAKVIDAKVVRLDEFNLTYKYAGEDAEQKVSKLMVHKIIYGSGREEEVSEKISVRGKDDWEKVEVLLDKSQIVGLKKVGEVQGKTTGFFAGYTSSAGTDKRSLKKLLEAAANLGAPFIYMTADKDAKGGMQSGAYGSQSNKRGIAYGY